jgi:hypothetical protein
MTSMNKSKVFNDIHLLIEDEAKYMTLSEELIKKAMEDHYNHDIINFYLLYKLYYIRDLTNNPNYDEKTLNRFVIINETMFKMFMKKVLKNNKNMDTEFMKSFKVNTIKT